MASAQASAQADSGKDLLDELLSQPPAQIAEWALKQVEEMAQPDVDIKKLPIFTLAGAFRQSQPQEKQKLVRAAIAGFGELPAARRAEAVRVAMRTERSASQDPQGVPLVRNLMVVANESEFNRMSQDELQGFAQEAQSVAVKAIQPDQLVEVVQELRPEEREKLSSVLVEAQVVSQDQKAVVDEAVRPGGYVDKLKQALEWLDWTRRWSWVPVTFSVAELVMALVFDLLHEPCGAPDVLWLNVDAVLTALAAGGAALAAWNLAEPLHKLREDPVGVVQRWSSSTAAENDWSARLECAIPGVPFASYRNGVIGVGILAIMVLLGAIWAIAGVWDAAMTVASGCSVAVACIWTFFWSVRLGIVIFVVVGITLVALHLRRSTSGPTESQEVKQPLLPAEEGAVEQTASPAQREELAQPDPEQPELAETPAASAGPPVTLEPLQYHEEVRSDYATLMQRLRERGAASGSKAAAPSSQQASRSAASAGALQSAPRIGAPSTREDRRAARQAEPRKSEIADVHARMQSDHGDALSRLDAIECGAPAK